MKKFTHFYSKVITILIAVIIITVGQSCKEKKLEPIKIDPAFAAYVMSFTSGVVSNSTKVRVRLVQEVADAVPGEELKFNPFSFSPSIKGKVVWLDKQTIEFTPEKRLPSGEIYTVDFDLYKFIEVPENLKVLTFRFQVMKQAMLYEFNGIEPYKLMEKKWQKVNGIFKTADFASPEEIEKCAEAESDGEEYKISWVHSKDGKTHNFTIDSVERKSKPVIIKLEWNGKKIGADISKTERIEMPALEDFKVIYVKTITNPQTSVKVFFSDPLNKGQDITGLFILEPSANETVIIDGNIAHIFLGKSVTGDVKLTVLASLKNVFDKILYRDYVTTLKFVSMKPQVELIGEGIIIPNANGILFPFRAVSLNAVDVTIIKIFENNIPQFLQVNQLDGDNEIKRVGRIVYKEEVPLTSDKPIDYGTWNTFSLDLSQLIEVEPGAIYRVEINFRKKHSLYPCSYVDDAKDEDESYVPEKDINAEYDAPEDYYYYEDDSYEDYEDYNWYESEDPCKNSYYMYNNRKVQRNILASDLGIIAKAGTNNEYNVVVTNLKNTEPIDGVDIEFRNYQNQIIGGGKTNSDGMCKVRLQSKPFLLIAKDDKQRGYLRLDDASSLSLSMFDVQGEDLKKGVKGFIYGERGVWRPGDSLYLSFILEDKNKSLPPNHPVIFELYNPESQLSQRLVKTTNVNGFYSFRIKTADDAPTGNWTAKVRVGGSTFSKTLRIETVKPNRMKINLSYPTKVLRKDKIETGKLQVNWLHGAPARNSRVEIDATIAATKTEFAGYKDYIFDDPAKSFTSKEMTVFQGNLNAEGSATVNTKLEIDENTPGMVDVQLKTRAYESGGDFSTDRFVMKYSPYSAYVGVKIPLGKGWNNALYSDEKNVIPIVLVDENGKPLNRKLKVEIYEVYWRWWWDQSDEENLADYISNQYSKLIKTDYVTTKNGKVMYEMNLGGEYWGRKLIRVYDETSGHSTGTTFYTTYKGWWSNAGSENPGGAEMLMFQTDKKQYSVGEKVTVELPTTHTGRALVSIETGSKVLQNFWVVASKGNSKFTFQTTPEMAPNIYIHVSFIQPHNHGNNDFPIRMYGVQSIKIENPATHLAPIISMPKTLKPQEKFTVNIKEAHGKPMTYTIAIVDEGLLDLTRFKTPDPWEIFYSHEALGVKTWDLYKYVAGAYTGKLAGLLAIGGDEYLNKKGKENTNRFKPVVLYKGPFTLKAGETKSQVFTMPNYVGSVRVMVVAGNEGAYGCAEQAVPVKQALMVLPTLPRVVSPTEVIRVPVTVFAMDPNAKNVTVKLSTDNNFEVLESATQQIIFTTPGDKTIEFKVRVKAKAAQGKIVVTATSGAFKSNSETFLQIRMPNPPSTDVISAIIKPGETWSQKVSAIGITGTNSGMVEVSKIIPINLENRLKYLITYPHGCIEQITSSAFPQLFIQKLIDVSPQQKAEIETNVKACLDKLKSYQLAGGGFSYWPGETYSPSDWGTNYTGHFMLEAQALGYQIPVGLYDAWLQHQTTEANNWRYSVYAYSSDINQAYRLYTLALAKKPAMSAMNRFRETQNLTSGAKWRLAAAYAIAGKPEIANQIIASIDKNKKEEIDYDYSYGSYNRDQAMILETLVLLKKYAQAKEIADELSKSLSSNNWLSTQTTAYMLYSISKFCGNSAGSQKLQCVISINGVQTNVNVNKPLSQTRLNFNDGITKLITIKNTSKQIEYIRIQLRGVPLMSTQKPNSENISMNVAYFDMKGKSINPYSLKQGTDFYSEITVTHPGLRMGYTNIAVEQMFPSGWEIINTRMDEIENVTVSNNTVRYQDIRDDRVYTYFDLDKNEKKVYRVLLHASYLGRFYLPSVYCSEMYDNTVHARSQGDWIEVVK